jgi:hypothetical protein
MSGTLRESNEYYIWHDMKRRCEDRRRKEYHRYGGRGVRVCDRWRLSFRDFLQDVGPRPTPGHSLDRFPNQNGDYEPGNVRWATQKEQTRNRKSNTYLTCGGETMLMMDWTKRTSFGHGMIRTRLRLGWTEEETLSIPRGVSRKAYYRGTH